MGTLQPMPTLDTIPANLQKMGLLVYRRDVGWRVNSVILVLLQIIANPDVAVRMQIKEKSGGAKTAYAYPHPDFPLFVVAPNDNLEFTFHPSINDLFFHAWAFLDLPNNLKHNIKPTNVISSEYLARLFREFSDITVDMLNNVHPLEADAPNLASLFQKIEYVGTISNMISAEGELSVISSCYLFWGHNIIWEGKLNLGGSAEFLPITRTAARKMLQTTLKI